MNKKTYECPEMEVIEMNMETGVMITTSSLDYGGSSDDFIPGNDSYPQPDEDGNYWAE